uniref:TSA: Wollemia nobilis Ref_Wollemi_Transcript_29402_1284 transcribed RNA sequence n=1 Tax=Wollemia nobilis TaxID=56998 RepID=A0A0C9RPF9_9CONI
MEVVSLLQPSTTILRAPAHVGALFSALKADTHLGSNGRRIPCYIKLNRNGIGHVGVAYDQSKRSRVIVPRASSTTAISKEADLLGSITIFTASGKPVEFRDLWDQNNGMAVVALLRHFGCVCCWELASTLKDVKPKFDSMGVKLIAIGVGTPDKARILAERLPFPLDSLYADPDRKAYNSLGLYHGLDRTFLNPASAKVFSRFDSFQKALKNYTVSATPQDISSVLQQGGMYVFKGKELLYARKDEGTGDHAPLDEVLNVCCTVPVS